MAASCFAMTAREEVKTLLLLVLLSVGDVGAAVSTSAVGGRNPLAIAAVYILLVQQIDG